MYAKKIDTYGTMVLKAYENPLLRKERRKKRIGKKKS